MSEETTNPTTETTKPKTRAAKAIVAPPTDAVDTFEYEFLEADKDFDNVDPKSLILAPFDSRSDSDKTPPDAGFVASVGAKGVETAVITTPVRHKKTGKTGLMLIAGRKRRLAAIENKLKTIPATIKTMTLREAVLTCGDENIQRQSLSFWDMASYMLMLRDQYGMKQTEIKDQLHVADSKVSQYLAVFDLDERVQKMVRKGQLDPGTGTKVRALKGIKDADLQYATAVKAVEASWTSDDIEEAVARIAAKAAAAEKAAKEKEKAKKAAKGEKVEASDAEDEPAFDPAEVKMLNKASSIALAEVFASKLEKIRAKEDVDPVKVAYAKGQLDAAKYFIGAKALPKSLADE